MTKKKKTLIILSPFILLFVVMLLLQKNFIYFSEEITGTVVDWETGKPIEGVCVTAFWIPYYPAPGSGGHKGVYMVYESVTDKEGRYRIPAWGPRPAPLFGSLDTAPNLYYFKKGYKFRMLANNVESNSMIRKSDWSGETIKMERFKGNAKELNSDLDYVDIYILSKVSPVSKVKYTAREWSEAVKEQKKSDYPYIQYMPDHIKEMLKKEFK